MLLFTDRSSRRADTFAVLAALLAVGTAEVYSTNTPLSGGAR